MNSISQTPQYFKVTMREIAENISSRNVQEYTDSEDPPIYTISTPSIEHYQRQSSECNLAETSSISVQTSSRLGGVSSLEPHQNDSLQHITRNQETDINPLHLIAAQNTTEEIRLSINNDEMNSSHREEENSGEVNLHHPAIIPIDTILEQNINSHDSKSESFIFMVFDFTSSYVGPPPLYEENPFETINSYEPPPHYSVINVGRSSFDSVLINPQDFIEESDSFHVKASRFLLLALTLILLIYIVRLIK